MEAVAGGAAEDTTRSFAEDAPTGTEALGNLPTLRPFPNCNAEAETPATDEDIDKAFAQTLT